MVEDVNDREEKKDYGEEGEGDDWLELRLQGKLPERRSNHCSFICCINDQEWLYIHGGRDLKEGAISTMWRVNLTQLNVLKEDPYHPCAWEEVKMNEMKDGPGKISHHTASVNGDTVYFYGGLKGEDSVKDIY